MFNRLVLAAALAFAAVTPVYAQTAPAAATAPDSVTVSMAEQAITNLGLIDVMIHGFDKGVREGSDFNDLTADQKEGFIVVFHQHIDAERPALIHKLALNVATKVSREEMTNMLALSKIGYLKAVIMASANDSTEPDPTMMSADEKAVFDRFSDADFVGRFLDGVDVNLIGDDMVRIGGEAYTAFEAGTKSGTT